MQSCCRTRRRFLRPLPFPAAAERRLPALCLRLLSGALARAGSAAAAGWDQRDPARPSPARQPPASPFSGQSRGGCNPKTWLDFCCCWEKSTFVSEKKVAVVSFLLCTRIPWPRGRLQRLEIHKTQIWAVLQLIADMGSAGQAAMSSAKVRICMCVCVCWDRWRGSFHCKGRLV